jgi:hypothetical protein
MATWDDVRRLALGLPETTETAAHGRSGDPAWKVRDKAFAWARPLRKGDLEALGADAPEGPILGARVEHEGAKLALIESDPAVYFTIPHFNGFSAVLARLDVIDLDELESLIVDAWLTRAPRKLADTYLAEHSQAED